MSKQTSQALATVDSEDNFIGWAAHRQNTKPKTKLPQPAVDPFASLLAITMFSSAIRQSRTESKRSDCHKVEELDHVD